MNGRLKSHIKKVIAAAVVLTLVSGIAPVRNLAELTDVSITASAYTTEGDVYQDKNVHWVWDPDTGTVTFSGSGYATVNTTILYKYRSYIKSIIVEDGITTIADFSGCINLKSVTLPDSLTTIVANTFNNDSSLKSIEIPDSVTSIGSDAFGYCHSLESVKLSKNIKSLESTFYQCEALEEVDVPSGVTSMKNAFSYCENLKTVNIPNGVTNINGAFSGCSSLEEIVIPNSVTSMNGAFGECTSLTAVIVPSSVENMEGAFSGCTLLKSANIPDGVTNINRTFQGCTALKSMTVPDSVTDMESAFYECADLETVNIPDGVTSIKQTFQDCASLKSIVVPDSVTDMEDAFNGCSSLESVNIPSGAAEIGDRAFSQCKSLTSIEFSNNVTTIGYDAFSNCVGLTSIDLGGVTDIRYNAFNGCTGLTKLTVPSSVRHIEGGAFDGIELDSVDFEGEEGIFFGYSAFGSLTEDVSIVIPRFSKGGQDDYYCDYIIPDTQYEYGAFNPKEYFGSAKVSVKDNGVTYTKVDAVQATCTTDGNEEYYKGSDGKYYSDSLGYEEKKPEDVIESAYGHNEKISWSWIKLSSGGYKAFAKIRCTRGDIASQVIKATVTSEETDEGTTYHAVVACPIADEVKSWGHTEEHTYDLFVESTKYSVTVEGGTITAATKKDEYKYNDSVTVKAAKEKDGKFFTGWYIGEKCVSTNPSYTFFVKENTAITAKYEEQETEQEAVISLNLKRIAMDSAGKHKIKMINSWSLPEGSTLVEAGVLRAYDTDIANITLDTAEENGVTRNTSSLKTVNGTYTLTVNMSYWTKLKTVNAKGYIIYTDAKGVTQTKITDMQTSKYVYD